LTILQSNLVNHYLDYYAERSFTPFRILTTKYYKDKIGEQMALSFPAGAVANDVYTEGQRSWRYNGTTWESINIAAINHSDTAPINPVDGQIWVDTTNGKMYYSQSDNWIQLTTAAHK
jgi:ligand-binding sensor domain-containing protein